MKRIVEEIQNYRIFSNLRPNVIAKIFFYLERVEFSRGRTIYREGDTNVDTVYFIKEGEYAVTKAVAHDLDIPDVEDAEKSKMNRVSPVRIQKIQEMMRTRSNKMLAKSSLGLIKTETAKKFIASNRSKTIQLYLLGKNEIFGMEEIVQASAARTFTVTCASTTGVCYKMTRNNF